MKYVSGLYHADNVSPILLGFTLVRSVEDLDIIKLPNPKNLITTIIRPEIEIKTSDSRKVVKSKVTIDKMVRQSANLAAFISPSLYTEDYELMSNSIIDEIIEPDRALLIPEYYNIKEISLKTGAIACGISGSGPTIFSLSKNNQIANDILNKTSSHFDNSNITYNGFVSIINSEGIKVIN